MTILFDVLTQVTLPIVALIAAGYFMTGPLRLDTQTLNRFFLFAAFPAFLLVNLSDAEIPVGEVQLILAVTVVQYFVLLAIGWGFARLLSLPREVAIIVAVAGAFPNSGNYGIPLIELAFGTDLVLPQAVITTLHLVLILITVPALMAAERHGLASLVKELFKTPLVPAVLLAIAFNVANVEIPGPIREPLAIMGTAYIPLALFVLGSQMRGVNFGGLKAAIGVATALRLLIAPVLTFAALLAIGVQGVTLAFLTVGATAPVGVLLSVLSQEYGLRAELPAATVLITTILAPVAATIVLVLFQTI